MPNVFHSFAPQAQEEKDLADCLNFADPEPEEEVEEEPAAKKA